MSDIEDIYQIRDYKESDFSFIMATFLRGLYYGNEFFKIMDKDDFMLNYKAVAEALIKKHTVIVAADKEDQDVIYGYSITSHDGQGIHWVYVKNGWRQKGIGKQLVPQNPSYFTHFSSLGLDLSKKLNNCVFNPFKLGDL